MAYVGVVGPSAATAAQEAAAERVGAGLARRGHVVVCGGRGGVMAAVSRGAAGAGGTVLGILPGHDRAEANEHVTVAVPTGMGEMRNALVVRASDVLVAVGSSWGTLSEVALAVSARVPVVGIGGWALPDDGPRRVGSADEALTAVDELLGPGRPG
ncbi:TIGR00725 family protein [Cellulomonas sp. zg-ZUI199]|uniref:TIGR00725 family protein n=1 Tax=Cellulomonas wangleii TaxID=2816956 RepID=A0ABX8D3J4_9CELL|nr:TIGR00725 family protein [Cellulomonas wangleii]MBO0923729.1 TIGR00725 family protein [Cellulomonas wangleii]MBO0924011.1 TIGR00725 family protein [Cellulomonas wangleii]QVI62040.1 TIGR00725 family protein [Cellulomonas wangleii]